MKFVHPMFLWALGIILIPIIVHLFNFRRYKVLYFSSLQFIKKIEKETNATRKLRHYLILLSRILAFIALVLAFAQPYFPLEEGKAEQHDSVTAIYLDNSYSMSAKGTNGDLLNQSKETIRSIVDKSKDGQQFMFVTNNLSGIEHRMITKSELLDRLETTDLSPIFRAFVNPLNSVKEHLDNKGFKGRRQYIILSDFQKINFQNDALSADQYGTYVPLKLTPQSTKNLYIDSVWFDNPFQRVNQNNTLNVRINNTSSNEITNAELNLEIGKFKRQTLVDIPSEGSSVVQLNYTDKTEGFKKAKVDIKDDQLFFDDVFYFTYEVKNSLRIQLVNGSQATEFPSLVFETDEFYEVSQTNIEQLQINTLKESDLVVLNGLETISSGVSSSIQQYINNGGNVLIIPGDDIDIDTYNSLLQAVKLPLIKDISSQKLRIGKIHSEQSFFQGMFNKSVNKLNMPALNKHFSSTIYTSSNYKPLVDLENKSPLFLVHGGDLGISCFYTALNESFNNFSKSALFSALLLRVGEISQTQNELQLTIGKDKVYKLRSSKSQDAPVELKNEAITFIPEINAKEVYDEISVRLAGNSQVIKAGNYNIIRENERLGWIALNFNRNESLLDYMGIEEVNDFFTEQGVNNVQTREIVDFNDIEQLSVEKPNEYWRILLILALAFFLIEMLIVLLWKV
ncbi:MAG: BatA domain-containing protein [Brumimicrobium sp.]